MNDLINWFPGHMTKALRMIEEEFKNCNLVLYVLDARAPFACFNRKLDKIFGNGRVIYLLNKSDLVDDKDIKNTISKFKEMGRSCLSTCGTNKKNVNQILSEIDKTLTPVKKKYLDKGINKTFRIMVAGLPNTGKSTIINSICGEKKTKTGDKAGVTRGKQWVKINGYEFLDTPGTTPPSFESQEEAKFLAYLGSINDEILDFIELSYDLISYLRDNYPNCLKDVYGIDVEGKDPPEIFREIGKKRGCLIKGGDIDEERTSSVFIGELRKGKLGKIFFNLK